MYAGHWWGTIWGIGVEWPVGVDPPPVHHLRLFVDFLKIDLMAIDINGVHKILHRSKNYEHFSKTPTP